MMMGRGIRRVSWLSAALLLVAGMGTQQLRVANAASPAAFTTVDATKDGGNFCKNGNLSGSTVINCNLYTAKPYVWLNGGPVTAALPDGKYFFAVLSPGGQPNPNDNAPLKPNGDPENLSVLSSPQSGCSGYTTRDPYANRTFTTSNGVISYGGTHDLDPAATAAGLIRLADGPGGCNPFADTPNPGGVYILAICSLSSGYPVDPRSCKYDAFKVTTSTQVTAVLSGEKYLDANRNGQLDSGETGIANWTISVTCVGCGQGGSDVTTTTTTDSLGNWSFSSSFASSASTTTYVIKEVQQTGWTETGNTVDQAVATGTATQALSNFVYTVTVPNNASSVVEGLNFGNVPTSPCPSNPSATGTSILGTCTQGTTPDYTNSDSPNGSQVTVGSQAETVSSMCGDVVAVDPNASHDGYSFAIYTDANGTPGTLVANSGDGTMTAAGWNCLPISATLQPNTTYWLMFYSNADDRTNSSSSYGDLYYTPVSSNVGAYSSYFTAPGAPISWTPYNPFSAPGWVGLGGWQFSLFANVSP